MRLVVRVALHLGRLPVWSGRGLSKAVGLPARAQQGRAVAPRCSNLISRFQVRRVFFLALSAFCRMSRRGFHAKLPWCAMLNFSALARSHGGRAAAVVASQDSGSEDHRMAAWDISTATMAALIQRAPRHLRCHLLRCRHTGAHHTRASTPRSNQHGLIVSFRNQARESELPIWRGCQAQAQALTSGPWFP